MAVKTFRSALHEAARSWAQAGFYVFPCVPNGKEPACANGLYAATTDLEKIDQWWKEADYNIGISPGPTAMWVLDVDGPLGAESLARLELEFGALPPTLAIQTPRGPAHTHYWFAGSCRSSVGKLGPKLDTRGEGGYVLVPPSVVNGKEYTYANESEDIAAGPEWIPRQLASRIAQRVAEHSISLDEPGNVERAKRSLQIQVEVGAVAIEGAGGDDQTYRIACEILQLGISPAKAWELLRDEWNPHCQPPWSEDELAVKVQNAADYMQNDIGAWAVPPAAEIFSHIVASLRPEELSQTQKKPSRFYPHALTELPAALKPPSWIIPGLIPEKGVVQIIGRQKSFKTFLALDLALGIASGRETFGFTPESRPVVYAVGENASTFGLEHVPAWRLARGVGEDFPFYTVAAVPKAMFAEEAKELIAEVKARGINPGVVVLDTMTRAMRGLDENNARDMGLFSEACDTVREALGCTVIVIRHTGKDSGRGGRGSNVFDGDCDTTLEVVRHEKSMLVALNVLDQRNAAEADKPWTFEGRLTGPSLVFYPIERGDYQRMTRQEDAYSPGVIGHALRELGAVGEAASVTTTVLASHLVPVVQDDTPEAREAAIRRSVRHLSRFATGRLEAYVSGSGKSLRWFLPVS